MVERSRAYACDCCGANVERNCLLRQFWSNSNKVWGAGGLAGWLMMMQIPLHANAWWSAGNCAESKVEKAHPLQGFSAKALRFVLTTLGCFLKYRPQRTSNYFEDYRVLSRKHLVSGTVLWSSDILSNYQLTPSAIDSDSIKHLSVLHSWVVAYLNPKWNTF